MRDAKNGNWEINKIPTGIRGFDDITRGGLPRGRTSLVFGAAGCGKTMFAMQFIARGAIDFGEPGIFMTFEETAGKLRENMRSVGIDLAELERKKKVRLLHSPLPAGEICEAGEYTLDGLFIRLEAAIDSIKAKRVALDSVETLFSGFENERILRAELKRLFAWFETKGVSAVVTGEKSAQGLTRHNLEDYIADCVVSLDHRVKDQISTRRLRVLKYRGTEHDTDEFPFLIDRYGMSVLPVTSVELRHPASRELISTGIPDLDKMFAKGGIYRGSSILVSGTAGTGKTTIAAAFVNGACSRKERALYFAFEESEDQLIRNMSSIGLKLSTYTRSGLLRYVAVRPTVNGLEAHLLKMQRLIDDFKPGVVVVDPISNFLSVGTTDDVKGMLLRLIDHLKAKQITTLFTSLTEGGAALEKTDIGVSSLIDTWLLLRDIEYRGERNRGLYVLKSRGTAHSNQIREFLITEQGIELLDVYVGKDGVLIGSARARKEREEKLREQRRPAVQKRREEMLTRKLRALEAQIALLRSTYEMEGNALDQEFEHADGEDARLLDEAEVTYRRNVARRAGRRGSRKDQVKSRV